MTTEEEERQEEERHSKLAIIPSKMYHKQRKTTRKKKKRAKQMQRKTQFFCIKICTVFALITCRRKNTQKTLTDVFVGVYACECIYVCIYIHL